MRHGDTLRNNAKVIAFASTPRGSLVLADASEMSQSKFVTWNVGAKGETFTGHYFNSEDEAWIDFLQRLHDKIPASEAVAS